jgi:hypothetical protein
LSAETNYRTEFVAVLSNQPQGGFITRAVSPSTNVARTQDNNGFGFGGWFGSSNNPPPPPPGRQPARGASYYPQRGWGSY